MRSMVSHKNVNVLAVADTHENRISMYPMEETKTMLQVLCSSYDNRWNMVNL